MRVRPFTAVRPPANRAALVSSPPYDVVDRAQAKAEIDRSPQSFMRVLRPEATLHDGVSPFDDAVYTAARAAFDAMFDEGALMREDTPCIYLYRQVWEGRSQVGVVCCCHVGDYETDVIRKHELTRKDKEDDRTRHVLTTDCNAGPVFLTYRDDPVLADLVDGDTCDRPLFHFIDSNGVTHTGWIAKDPQAYVTAFDRIGHAYVADGHHRSASAARAAASLRDETGEDNDAAPWNWFLSVLFPAGDLTILPYNRLVADLNGHTTEAFLHAMAQAGTVTKHDCPVEPGCPGDIGVYVAGAWYLLQLHDPDDDADAVESIDCARLSSAVLGPVLNIHDLRTDQRIAFLGGVHGVEALQAKVDAGEAAAAFAMHAVSIDQLMDVADGGHCMPPKSTWFEPKLRSGLFVHKLDAPARV
ncbi:MAG: DUF1015 domain-containing protein [Phycisphaerales bacterium]|nr:DUF1015 domain-containing protein [Phycisphaerales bacterium]